MNILFTEELFALQIREMVSSIKVGQGQPRFTETNAHTTVHWLKLIDDVDMDLIAWFEKHWRMFPYSDKFEDCSALSMANISNVHMVIHRLRPLVGTTL